MFRTLGSAGSRSCHRPLRSFLRRAGGSFELWSGSRGRGRHFPRHCRGWGYDGLSFGNRPGSRVWNRERARKRRSIDVVRGILADRHVGAPGGRAETSSREQTCDEGLANHPVAPGQPRKSKSRAPIISAGKAVRSSSWGPGPHAVDDSCVLGTGPAGAGRDTSGAAGPTTRIPLVEKAGNPVATRAWVR